MEQEQIQIPQEPTEPVETTEQPEKKKRGRRRISRSKGKSPPKLYFHSGTQDAIVAYQKSPDNKKERERLYVTDILPAFEKLVENLINIHKFSSLHDSYDDLKNDCVNFLFETIKKFVNPHGKIMPRRRTNLSAANQRALAQAVKRARFMALLPYIVR